VAFISLLQTLLHLYCTHDEKSPPASHTVTGTPARPAPVHVAELNHVVIYKTQGANACCCQIEGSWWPQASTTYDQHFAVAQLALTSYTEAGEQNMPTVALHLIFAEPMLRTERLLVFWHLHMGSAAAAVTCCCCHANCGYRAVAEGVDGDQFVNV